MSDTPSGLGSETVMRVGDGADSVIREGGLRGCKVLGGKGVRERGN